jgi:hypothetical protein
MRSDSSRWTEIGPTQFPWEREALDYVRERLPDHDPYRAFALFEFIASDGSINEVDLLAITATRWIPVRKGQGGLSLRSTTRLARSD